MTVWIKPPAPPSVLVARGFVTLSAAVVCVVDVVLSLLLRETMHCTDGLKVPGCLAGPGWSWSLWWTMIPLVAGVLSAIAALMAAFRHDTVRQVLLGMIYVLIGAIALAGGFVVMIHLMLANLSILI